MVLAAGRCCDTGRSDFPSGRRADSPSEILRQYTPLFEQAVRELLYRGGETGVEIPGVTDISVYGVSDGTIVQFTTETKAGLSGRRYRVFTMPSEAAPAAYRNWDYELIYDESDGGWNWYSAERRDLRPYPPRSRTE